MQIWLLNGRPAKINLARYRRKGLQGESRSGFQFRVGQILAAQYPHDLICGEVVIPGEGLILDYLVPSLCLAIECQGRQHEEFVPFFHATRKVFHDQQHRDMRKRQWCELNSLRLLEVPHDATDDQIAAMIRGEDVA
jgi:hypothetical protein